MDKHSVIVDIFISSVWILARLILGYFPLWGCWDWMRTKWNAILLSQFIFIIKTSPKFKMEILLAEYAYIFKNNIQE